MMRTWTCLLAIGALLAMSPTGLGQRAAQPSPDQRAQGRDAGGAGGARGTAGGFGIGGPIDQNLSNPDEVFDIDRGNTIGASAANVQGFSAIGSEGSAAAGRGGALGGAFGGGFGGLGGLFGGASRFGGAQQQDAKKRIRTRLRADISVQDETAPQVEARIENRLARLPSEPRFRNVNIEMRGRTAVLNGKVGNGEDRRMAELLIRLEPGVSKIENRLLVASDELEAASALPLEIPAPPANETAGE